MEKIIRRVRKASRVATKQKEKAEFQREIGERWERNSTRTRLLREQHKLIQEERKNRQHDWMVGPLAPRRDIGDLTSSYGAIPISQNQFPDADLEFDSNTKVKNTRPRWHHIRAGDRVVILFGRDRGKIGSVTEVIRGKRAVIVKGMNMIDLHIPKWLQQEYQQDGDVLTREQQILVDHVKLVYPLPDPQTKQLRDVVIDRLVCVHRKQDPKTKEWDDGLRAIPGMNTIIPWPVEADPVHEDVPDDTLRISVDEQTFQPFLLRPPMPLSVIDELRGKFSRFRTRQDYDQQVKQEREIAREESRKELIRTMRTPRQELAELRAKQKETQRKELTREQLATIGEVIAQQQASFASPRNAVA